MVKNNIVSYEFIRNIRLTFRFRKICSAFLNYKVNELHRNKLIKTITIIKKVIKGRPTVQYYVQNFLEGMTFGKRM